MVSNNNFFDEKKSWSKYKDNILDYYLSPYIPKIQSLTNPTIIIDCFAGAGKFKDGAIGSPLIISSKIQDFISLKPINNKINLLCIENSYYDELKENLKDFKFATVINDNFENCINLIKEKTVINNIFLYIDPFGPKTLNFNNLKNIKDSSKKSIELLMNFNSKGFIREGCRIKKIDCTDLINDTEIYSIQHSEENWNNIANGNYWQVILEDTINKKISFIEAEDIFINEYTKKLRTIFKYVFNIPIYKNLSHCPEYRLFFATDNKHGFKLMVDTMNKFWNDISNKDSQLFDYFFPNLDMYKDLPDIKDFIIMHLNKSTDYIFLEDFIYELVKKYSIHYAIKDYIDKFKEIENSLNIIREPKITPTGKLSRSWDFTKNKIKIKLK